MSDDSSKSDAKSTKHQQVRTPSGMHDVLPKDHEFHTFIKKVVRHRARQAGFRRITTPIVESTELFQRGVGEDTDIVGKEMYTFMDKSERSLTLKPEGTAGVVRSYIQHGMQEWPQPVKLYYIEPNFRYDRPQKGRYRMFWQIGFETLGEIDPGLDVEAIFTAWKIFEDLGIQDRLTLQLNNIGTPKSREKYIEALQNYYIGKERSLNEVDQARIHSNPLRLLDSKDEDAQILAELAPKFEQFRSKEETAYHETVKAFLTELGIPFTENERLVRGLDYYTQTVFEFWDKETHAQNAVGGGGRYDGLAELLGGKETPGMGFALGMERLILQMKQNNVRVPSKDNVHIVVVQIGDLAKMRSMTLVNELRERGLHTIAAFGKTSLKAQLRLADKFEAPYALILGSTEVREGTIIIRNMAKGQQRHVPIDQVTEEMVKLIGEDELDTYTPGEAIVV